MHATLSHGNLYDLPVDSAGWSDVRICSRQRYNNIDDFILIKIRWNTDVSNLVLSGLKIIHIHWNNNKLKVELQFIYYIHEKYCEIERNILTAHSKYIFVHRLETGTVFLLPTIHSQTTNPLVKKRIKWIIMK